MESRNWSSDVCSSDLSAQSCALLWVFWVDNGSVPTLQVLGDACWMTLTVLQLHFTKEALEL